MGLIGIWSICVSWSELDIMLSYRSSSFPSLMAWEIPKRGWIISFSQSIYVSHDMCSNSVIDFAEG